MKEEGWVDGVPGVSKQADLIWEKQMHCSVIRSEQANHFSTQSSSGDPLTLGEMIWSGDMCTHSD